MDFSFDPLPEEFVLGKPLKPENYDKSLIYEIEKRGSLIITRKRDGWKLFAVVYKGKVKIYTAGLEEIDSRLNHIKKDIVLLNLPSRTVLVGEGLIIKNGNGSDDFNSAVKVFKSKEKDAIEFQVKNRWMKFMIFNILFYGGQPVYNKPYSEILKMVNSIMRRNDAIQHLFPVQVLKMDYDQAKELTREQRWEGLVLYDKNFRNTYRLDGKNPQRPRGCYKWKPMVEDDFIVHGWNSSRDDPSNFKDVDFFQVDPETGENFRCGTLGGFTKSEKEYLMKEAVYPLVMQIKFELRFESGKVRFPRFVRFRTDKKPSECIAPQNYKTAR